MRLLLFNIFIVISISNMYSFTNTEDRYYFQTNIQNVESLLITLNIDGTYSIENKNNKIETDIYKNYTVFEFKKAYPNTKKKLLKTVYTIITNKVELLGALLHNFPEKYTRIDQFYPNENVYYPNDYGSTSPVENLGTHYPLYDLDLVNAPGAWGITKGSNKVVIGFSDAKIDSTNKDIKGRISNYIQYFDINKSIMSCAHGTNVAGIAIATMDNGYGRPGICPECDVIASGYGNFQRIEDLVEAGARVINASWARCSMGSYHENIEERINEFYDDGIIIVAGAGNGKNCNPNDDFAPDDYAYPASFEKVISVTGVYTTYENPSENIFIGKEGRKATDRLKDRHMREYEIMNNGEIYPKYLKWGMQRNYSIDICAPAESYLLGHDICGLPTTYGGATSNTAPYITGIIGLMWSVNYCLSSYEVESILKLTSVDIENLSGNTIYKTKLGAGRVDAYKAVKMAKQMKEMNGNVVISNRDFYRFDFKLNNAPFNITINNQTFRDSSTVDFKARNAIKLKPNTVLRPDSKGYIKLSIDHDLATEECFRKPPKKYDKIYAKKKEKNSQLIKEDFYIKYNPKLKSVIVTPAKQIKNSSNYIVKIYSHKNKLLLEQQFNLQKTGLISLESISEKTITVIVFYNNKTFSRKLVVKL